MPSPPWHLRPYSPPSEPEEEPSEQPEGAAQGDEAEGEAGGEADGAVPLGAVPLLPGAEESEVEGEAAEADGGEGGEGEGETGGCEGVEAEGAAVGEAGGGEGGELAVVAAVEKPWAPKETEELLNVITTQDYGVSDDRSSMFATPAIKAYNDELMKANGQSSEHMVAANNVYERNAKKKRGDEGWMSPEAAIEAYNEQVRAEIAKVAPTAIKAYNGKAGIYEQVGQKKGHPRREGCTIVKVRATCMHVLAFPMARRWLLALFGNQPEPPGDHTVVGRSCLIWQPTRTTG